MLPRAPGTAGRASLDFFRWANTKYGVACGNAFVLIPVSQQRLADEWGRSASTVQYYVKQLGHAVIQSDPLIVDRSILQIDLPANANVPSRGSRDPGLAVARETLDPGLAVARETLDPGLAVARETLDAVAISGRGFEGSSFEGKTFEGFEGAPLLLEGEGAAPPNTSSGCRSCTVDGTRHFRGHELFALVAARLEGPAAEALWRANDKGARITLGKALEMLEAERRWDGERLAAHLTSSVPADHACPVALLLPKARAAAGELHATGPRPVPPAARSVAVTPPADDRVEHGGVLETAGPRRVAAGPIAARLIAERAAANAHA